MATTKTTATKKTAPKATSNTKALEKQVQDLTERVTRLEADLAAASAATGASAGGVTVAQLVKCLRALGVRDHVLSSAGLI